MPHHNLLIILLCLSTHLSFLPVRSSVHCLDRPQLHLILTQTYIHLNKLPSAYITSTARSRHSLTHLSLLTATLLLCGDIQPNPGPTHPANLLICTLNTRSMLTPEHGTALNDLIDNHKSDIIALTETWIRSSTTPAELIDSTPPGYSVFYAPRSHTGNPSKPILAGGTAFLIREPFIQNSAAHHYSSFEYSSITLKFPKAQLTLFNVYRTPPPSLYSQPFSTFLNQFSSFLSQPLPLMNSSLLATQHPC